MKHLSFPTGRLLWKNIDYGLTVSLTLGDYWLGLDLDICNRNKISISPKFDSNSLLSHYQSTYKSNVLDSHPGTRIGSLARACGYLFACLFTLGMV